MPKTRLISPGIANHSLKKNLILNGHYISNDGDDEGIKLNDGGGVEYSTSLTGNAIGNAFDVDFDGTTSASGVGLQLAGSVDSAVASGQTVNFFGLDLDILSSNASTVGSINLYGIDLDVVGRTEGTQVGYGMDINVSGSDTNYGINCLSTDRQLRLGYDAASYLDITIVNDSHTTLATAESGNITLDAAGDIALKPAGGDIAFNDGASDIFKFDVATPSFYIYDDADTDGVRDYFNINVGTAGATTITTNDDGGSLAHLQCTIDGNVDIDGSHITLDASGDVILDADGDQVTMKFGGATGQIDFTSENSGDGVIQQKVDSKDLVIQQFDGNEVARFTDGGDLKITNTVYFASETANVSNFSTSNAATIDWNVSQKQNLTITGTGQTITFTDPAGACNLLLRITQGDGGDEIGTWDGSILWAGSSPPTLSTGNGNIDIISFYWDGSSKYYGVASLNFS